MTQKEKRKLSLAPPALDPSFDREKFLAEPEKHRQSLMSPTDTTNTTDMLPWEAPGVTPKVIKQFLMRFPEPDYLKMQHVVLHSGGKYKSMHDFCMQTITNKIKELL